MLKKHTWCYSVIVLAKTVAAPQHKRSKAKKVYVKFLTPTRTWKCTRSTVQISFLYASDFPFKIKTSSNSPNRNRKQKLVTIKHCSEKLTISLDTREESFLAKTLFKSQKLMRTTCARRSYSFKARNLKSCFHPWKTHLFPLPQNKKCGQKFADSRRREFGVNSLEM